MVYPHAGRPSRPFASRARCASCRCGTRRDAPHRHAAPGEPRRADRRLRGRGASRGHRARLGGAALVGTATGAGARQLVPVGPEGARARSPRARRPPPPAAPIILTFSRPLANVLGSGRPQLRPRIAGAWRQPNDHTLVFQPSGLGYPLGRRVHVRLPSALDVISGTDPRPYRTLTWQVPRGSLLRLRQMLADTGYLPLEFRPSSPVPATAAGQLSAAVEPPDGPGTGATRRRRGSSGRSGRRRPTARPLSAARSWPTRRRTG